MERTDLVTAYEKVVNALKHGQQYTLRGLAQETGLNPRTVSKTIKLLKISEAFCQKAQIEISRINKIQIIRAKPVVGLARLPGQIQNLLIRTAYFPTVSRDEEVLVHLYIKDAVNPNKAINMTKDKTLSELVKAEHIAKTKDGRYYLTKDGQMIAKGAIEIYPEFGTEAK